MLDSSLIDEILHKADIVDIISSYLHVIKKGHNYVAVCPFHDDKNPSMMISKDKQIFKCFVCGTGGNAFTFVQKYEKISYEEAVRKVAEKINFSDPRLTKEIKKVSINEDLIPLYNALDDLTKFYEYALLTEEGKIAKKYLEQRNIDDMLSKEYRIGYAFKDSSKSIEYLKSKGYSLKTIGTIGIAAINGSNLKDKNSSRVIFPIMDTNGKVIGYSARRLDDSIDEAKYVNSPETKLFRKNEILFNYHNAKQLAKHEGYVYLLEGFMDVFALRRAGIQSAIALMGTAFTNNHVAMIRKLGVEVRLCLDGDNPGQTATMKICKILDQEGIPYRIVKASDDRDPDEIINQNGIEALKDYVTNLINKAEFALQFYLKTNKLQSLEDRKNLVQNLLPILCCTNNQLEFEDYVLNVSRLTGFDVNTIKDIVKKAKNPNTNELDVNQVINSYHPERKHLKRLYLAEKELLYYMLHDSDAIRFFEEKIEYFVDNLNQLIADYILEYYSIENDVDSNGIINLLSQSEDETTQDAINELSQIINDDNHPPFNNNVKADFDDVIKQERSKLFLKEEFLKSINSDISLNEKTRLIDEYNKQKMEE